MNRLRRRKVRCTALALCVCVLSLSAQPSKPKFEVASVRKQEQVTLRPPSGSRGRGGVTFSRGGTLAALAQDAYGVARWQLIGGPDWIRRDRFDIDARAATEASPAELRLMMQSLLEDRFKLVVRNDRRDMRYLAMTLAGNGPGPRLTKCEDPANPPAPRPVAVPPDGFALNQRCAPISTLTNLAAGVLGTPVLDATGLVGMWNFELTYAETVATVAGNLGGRSTPDISTALREQLGLTLDSRRGPVDVLIVDAAEPPTPN